MNCLVRVSDLAREKKYLDQLADRYRPHGASSPSITSEDLQRERGLLNRLHVDDYLQKNQPEELEKIRKLLATTKWTKGSILLGCTRENKFENLKIVAQEELERVQSILTAPMEHPPADETSHEGYRLLAYLAQHNPAAIVDFGTELAKNGFLKITLFDMNFISTEDHIDTRFRDWHLDLARHLNEIYVGVDLELFFSLPGISPEWKLIPMFAGAHYPNDYHNTHFLRVDTIPPAIRYKNNIYLFYGMYHPQYSSLVKDNFPIPASVASKTFPAEDAISRSVLITRIEKSKEGDLRVYFYDPSHDPSKDDFYTGTVSGNGEHKGELSLPFYEFAALACRFPLGAQRLKPPLSEIQKSNISSYLKVDIFKLD